MRKVKKHLLVVIAFIAMATSAENSLAQDNGKLGNNKVMHVALVVRDIEKSSKAYADMFGVGIPKWMLTDKFEQTHTQFAGKPTEARAKLAFLRLENIAIELIEPVGGPSTWQEFLEKKGEGVHHIAFGVRGMDEHVLLLQKKGGKLIQHGDFTGGSYAYMDLTQQLGVIIELLKNANEK